MVEKDKLQKLSIRIRRSNYNTKKKTKICPKKYHIASCMHKLFELEKAVPLVLEQDKRYFSPINERKICWHQ